jgi:methionyl-tRNA formyltransferase
MQVPTYCGMRIPEDGRINWQQSAQVVHNFIRAQARPYPGAYTLMTNDEVLRIWRAALDTREFLGVPGSVVEVLSDSIVVACGSGAISISITEMSCEVPTTLLSSLRSLKVRFK